MKIRTITSALLVLVFAVTISSCDSGGGSTTEFETLRSKIASTDTLYAYTTAAAVGTVDGVTSEALYDNTTDYQIIDVRDATSYGNGHVPNADNIVWDVIADDESLLESGKTIIIYCKTSNTGGFATALLNVLGYSAKNMKWAMMGYNSGEQANLFSCIDSTDVVTDAEVSSTYDLPELTTGESKASAIAKVQYTAAVQSGRFISAANVQIIVDGVQASSNSVTLSDGITVVNPADYQIVSVRAADWYAGTGSYTDTSDVTHINQGGHIPGAINIPTSEIANKSYLKKLDPTKTQIVYCYTGHSGAISAAILNMLGYDALNMKFGMAAWTSDATVNKSYTFSGAEELIVE